MAICSVIELSEVFDPFMIELEVFRVSSKCLDILWLQHFIRGAVRNEFKLLYLRNSHLLRKISDYLNNFNNFVRESTEICESPMVISTCFRTVLNVFLP